MHGKEEFAKIKGIICNVPIKQVIYVKCCQDGQIVRG